MSPSRSKPTTMLGNRHKKHRREVKKSADAVAVANKPSLNQLADLLRSMPLGQKKFRYGAHFAQALYLFEQLSNDAAKLAATIDYLKKEGLIGTFKLGCIESFNRQHIKFNNHARRAKELGKKIADISEKSKAEAKLIALKDEKERQVNKTKRRINPLIRLAQAMRQTGTDEHIAGAFDSRITEMHETAAAIIPPPKPPRRRRNKNPTQLEISGRTPR